MKKFDKVVFKNKIKPHIDLDLNVGDEEYEFKDRYILPSIRHRRHKKAREFVTGDTKKHESFECLT